MRPEVKEYPFDWMLWSTMQIASRAMKGSEKEFSMMLNYMPYFRGLLELLVQFGDAGKEFINVLNRVINDIMFAHDQNKKRGMTTFCFSPILFHAMDIVPIILEPLTVLPSVLWKRGTYDYMDFCCEIGFTETSCSSQRGSLGAYLAGLCQDIDFIVVDSGGVCDTNANAFSFAAAYMNKPLYQLDYPATIIDERTKAYQREDFKKLIEFLEQQTGQKLNQDRLKDVLEETRKQDKFLSEIEEMQLLIPNPVPVIFNLFIYAGRFLATGLPEYTKLLETMRNISKENAQKKASGLLSKKENCRALFCYIDHYTAEARLWDWLDNRGVTHLGNILSRYYADNMGYLEGREDNFYTIQTQTLDSMIDTITDINARSPMVRSIRGPYDAPYMWLHDTLSLAKLYRVDCVIYNGTPGCRNTWGMLKPFVRDVEKAGFPTHVMYADAFDDRVQSWEATAERLDEFFTVRRLIS